MTGILDTYRGLLAPRRLLPTLLVIASLLVAEVLLTRSGRIPLVAMMICGGFWLLGPATWRALFPVAWAPNGQRWARLLAYFAVGVAFVVVFAVTMPRMLKLEPGLFADPGALMAVLGLFLVGGWGLAQDIDQQIRLQQMEARAEALEKKARMSELLALKAHLDPHFVFNTLNAIAEWCIEDGAVAERACLALADLLRELMEGVHVSSWPLKRELELAEKVLALHHARDPGRFRYELPMDGYAEDLSVPPLVLLPLIENAVKHGPALGHTGVVSVRVERVPAGWQLTVDNPGPYRGPREGGKGLALVRERLALSVGPAASLSLQPHENESTRATVVIPDGEAGRDGR